MSHALSNTPVTIEYIQELLQANLKTDAIIKDWECEEIGIGRGMMSHMLRISLIWDKNSGNLPSSVVAKVPSCDGFTQLSKAADDEMMSKIQAMVVGKLQKIHNCETAVYNLFGKMDKPPVIMPKLFKAEPLGTQKEALILMEDLSVVSGSPDLISSLSLPQITQLVEQVTSVQAWSILNEDWKSPEITMAFEDIMGEMDMDYVQKFAVFSEEIKEPKWQEALGQNIISQMDKLKCNPGDIKKFMGIHRELGIPDVLVHGDFHCGNLMIEKDQKGELTGDLKSIVDWQISHPGSPAEDLVRLFTTSVPTSIRRSHGDAIIQHYYTCLQQKLGNISPPFTLEQFKRAFDLLLQFTCRSFFPMLPVISKMMLGGVLKTKVTPGEAEKEMIDRNRDLMEDALKIIDKYGTACYA